MERVRPEGVTTAPEVVPSLAAVDQPQGAPQLDAFARDARLPGSEGRAALSALHAALASLAPAEASGRALLALLDQGAFHQLVGDDGTPTRVLAVEALLRLGYPWALEVHPDELAWYRATVEARRRTRRLMILLGILGLELLVLAALSIPAVSPLVSPLF